MSRKRYLQQMEEPENHERWLVSYADFITLLFAFFVVMYAISSVNDGKYKVLSHSLINAFNNQPAPIPAAAPPTPEPPPIVMQQPVPMDFETPIQEFPFIPKLPPIIFQEPIQANSKLRIKRKEKMRNMAKDIMQALAPLVQDGKVRVTQSIRGITVEINASVLFSPGQAKLAKSSSQTLSAVAQVIKNHNHEINVEGHTDNIPINTVNFPSNWELSTARSSSVIRLFIENGVAPHRLTALGYGENRSIETNDTLDGRKRNRRVAIMILSAEPDKITEIPVNPTSESELTQETIE